MLRLRISVSEEAKPKVIDGLRAIDGVDRVTSDRDELDADWVICLLYTSPSPRDGLLSRMPSSA